MTSIADHSTTISSAISHYLPLETPTASTSLLPVTSANLYSTVPTTTTRTYQESSMRPETPMSFTCTSSPDQDPYAPEISPSVQYIFDQDLIQDEDAEYILPQILGSEAPQTSTPKPQPLVQTPPPSFAQPPTPNLNQQILTALSTFTTTQELLLKEIAHNTKSIQTLSTDIAYLRGQVRQFERVQGRQQTILNRLSNLSNRPFKPIRRKPYLNRPKPQQRQPKVRSVVEKKNADSKENILLEINEDYTVYDETIIESSASQTEENNETTEKLKTKHKREMNNLAEYIVRLEKKLSARDQEILELKRQLKCNELFIQGFNEMWEDKVRDKKEQRDRKR
ncbi:unnamed protein product [Mytilus coruscus]|uniref:Uncharacterized protein n=1 Tax=Mytilus coruscus TaxID=42192 RepID=A0A6J8AJ42_MYTCO|nr:unnamed protein product [Mytilus coruscus]